jgi:hypothetical protein
MTRVIAALELLLIVLPTSALALWIWIAAIGDFPRPAPIPFILPVSLALVAIAGVWRLLTSLVLGGYKRVALAHRAWWLAMYAGGLFVFSGLLTSLVVRGLLEPANRSQPFLSAAVFVAYLGLPMFVPLTHLLIERFRYERCRHERLTHE